MSHDPKKVYAALTGERRTKKKKSRREARERFRAAWNLNATKVGLVSTELYQRCVKVAHGVKGVPDVWRYQTGTDTIQDALQAIGVPVDISELDTQKKIKWMLEAFRRVSEPPPRDNLTATELMMKMQQRLIWHSAPLIDYAKMEARMRAMFVGFDEAMTMGYGGSREPKEIGGHSGTTEDHVERDESGG